MSVVRPDRPTSCSAFREWIRVRCLGEHHWSVRRVIAASRPALAGRLLRARRLPVSSPPSGLLPRPHSTSSPPCARRPQLAARSLVTATVEPGRSRRGSTLNVVDGSPATGGRFRPCRRCPGRGRWPRRRCWPRWVTTWMCSARRVGWRAGRGCVRATTSRLARAGAGNGARATCICGGSCVRLPKRPRVRAACSSAPTKQGLAIRRGTGRAALATAHKILRPGSRLSGAHGDQEQGAVGEDAAAGEPASGGCEGGRRAATGAGGSRTAALGEATRTGSRLKRGRSERTRQEARANG